MLLVPILEGIHITPAFGKAPQLISNRSDFKTVYETNEIKGKSLELEAALHIDPSEKPLTMSGINDDSKENRFTHPLQLAAPENLNPGLFIPLPSSLPDLGSSEPATLESGNNTETSDLTWTINGLTVKFSDELSNFDQSNRFLETTITGELNNGDRISFTTGLNTFAQPTTNPIINVPIRISWTGTMGDFTTTIGGGVDIFNQSSLTLTAHASTTVSLGRQATLSLFVDQGPYKFNAITLDNQITSLRYGPNLYWQITPSLSLFSLARWGHYNDSNHEQQSFSRLEDV